MGNISDSAVSGVAEGSCHRCRAEILSHPGLRPKVCPTRPSYRQVFGAEGCRQVKPWLVCWPCAVWGKDGWVGRVGCSGWWHRAPGWLLCTAHSTALHRMALPSLQLISASKLFSAVFPKTSKWSRIGHEAHFVQNFTLQSKNTPIASWLYFLSYCMCFLNFHLWKQFKRDFTTLIYCDI